MTTTATHNDDTSTASEAAGRSVPAKTVLLFLAGLVMLILAAANLTNLSVWADRWGQILVFFSFFFYMMVAGNWFTSGIRALWAAVRGNQEN